MSTVYFIDSIFVLSLTIGYQIFVNDLLSKLNDANSSRNIYISASITALSTSPTSSDFVK